jgi:hypothetical protein
MFSQTWESTACGYGGMGGAAMTPAYTIIVSDNHGTSCVYFGCGRLAYRVSRSASREGWERFMEDIRAKNLAGCGENSKYN